MAFLLKTNHHDFRAITANLTAISKINSFAATADLYLTGKNLITVTDLVERAQGLSKERNRIVHGFWYPTKNPNVANRIAYVARGGKLRSEVGECVCGSDDRDGAGDSEGPARRSAFFGTAR